MEITRRQFSVGATAAGALAIVESPGIASARKGTQSTPEQSKSKGFWPNETQPPIASFGCILVDFCGAEVYRAGAKVSLTAYEFKVLRYFVNNPGRVLCRHELLDKVWGYNAYPTTRAVDNLILKLRQKLESDPRHPAHFVTVHGIGYKFVSEEFEGGALSRLLTQASMRRDMSVKGEYDSADLQTTMLEYLSVVYAFLARTA
jgi:DNA-binding winged helix-turn-helix (wHTH) protein